MDLWKERGRSKMCDVFLKGKPEGDCGLIWWFHSMMKSPLFESSSRFR